MLPLDLCRVLSNRTKSLPSVKHAEECGILIETAPHLLLHAKSVKSVSGSEHDKRPLHADLLACTAKYLQYCSGNNVEGFNRLESDRDLAVLVLLKLSQKNSLKKENNINETENQSGKNV